MTKLCTNCGERKPLALRKAPSRHRGRHKRKLMPGHTLCAHCFRDLINSERAKRLRGDRS